MLDDSLAVNQRSSYPVWNVNVLVFSADIAHVNRFLGKRRNQGRSASHQSQETTGFLSNLFRRTTFGGHGLLSSSLLYLMIGSSFSAASITTLQIRLSVQFLVSFVRQSIKVDEATGEFPRTHTHIGNDEDNDEDEDVKSEVRPMIPRSNKRNLPIQPNLSMMSSSRKM